MTATPKVAVLGAGRIARMFHLRALQELGVEVVAVADPDPAALDAARGRFPDAAMLAGWEEAVHLAGVDAVVVTMPTHLHGLAAIAAFEAGKHVYVEKPLAVDLAEATAVADAWRRAGTVGAVGLNFRFQPLVLDARRRVAAGQLGRIVGVRGTVCSPPRELPDWKRSRRTGGGALLDLAVHHLDVVPYVLDDPLVSVAAQLRSVRTADDTAVLTATTRAGIAVQLLASAASRQTDRLEILGDEQVLTVDRFRSGVAELAPVESGGDRASRARAGLLEVGLAGQRVRQTVAPSDEPSFRAALGAFLQAVAAGVQARPSIEDGVAVAAAIDAAERSAARGGAPEPLA